MVVTKTRHGLRLCQHGVVISELRTSPGPTQSVFDVLAALVAAAFSPSPGRRMVRPRHAAAPGASGVDRPRVAVLGFAGGGMMAPLRALGCDAEIETCDLDRPAYQLFRRHCPQWARAVRWHHADASAWLEKQSGNFDLVVEDLSVPLAGDVIKPPVCWESLPQIIRRKLKPDGLAVFNLLPREEALAGRWAGFERLLRVFPDSLLVTLDEYVNRILVAGPGLPSAAGLGRILRPLLRAIGSRQGERLRVRRARVGHRGKQNERRMVKS